MKLLTAALYLAACAAAQTANTCTPTAPCLVLFNGTASVPTYSLVKCTLTGTALSCPALSGTPGPAGPQGPQGITGQAGAPGPQGPPGSGFPSVAVTASGAVLTFSCTNLQSIPAFSASSCFGTITATSAPSASAAVWIGLDPNTGGQGIVHMGVTGIATSQFACSLPTTCLIDTNVGPDVSGEFAVAQFTLVSQNNLPVFQQAGPPSWSGMPGMFPVWIPLYTQ